MEDRAKRLPALIKSEGVEARPSAAEAGERVRICLQRRSQPLHHSLDLSRRKAGCLQTEWRWCRWRPRVVRGRGDPGGLRRIPGHETRGHISGCAGQHVSPQGTLVPGAGGGPACRSQGQGSPILSVNVLAAIWRAAVLQVARVEHRQRCSGMAVG